MASRRDRSSTSVPTASAKGGRRSKPPEAPGALKPDGRQGRDAAIAAAVRRARLVKTDRGALAAIRELARHQPTGVAWIALAGQIAVLTPAVARALAVEPSAARTLFNRAGLGCEAREAAHEVVLDQLEAGILESYERVVESEVERGHITPDVPAGQRLMSWVLRDVLTRAPRTVARSLWACERWARLAERSVAGWHAAGRPVPPRVRGACLAHMATGYEPGELWQYRPEVAPLAGTVLGLDEGPGGPRLTFDWSPLQQVPPEDFAEMVAGAMALRIDAAVAIYLAHGTPAQLAALAPETFLPGLEHDAHAVREMTAEALGRRASTVQVKARAHGLPAGQVNGKPEGGPEGEPARRPVPRGVR